METSCVPSPPHTPRAASARLGAPASLAGVGSAELELSAADVSTTDGRASPSQLREEKARSLAE